MEDLAGLGLADDSFDVVISNCVLNLSQKKERVFAEIFRVLKPDGELYFPMFLPVAGFLLILKTTLSCMGSVLPGPCIVKTSVAS